MRTIDTEDSGNRPPAGRPGIRSIIVGATLSLVVAAAAFATVSWIIPGAQNNSAGPGADPVAASPSAGPPAASPTAEPGNQGVVTTLAGTYADIWAADYVGPDANSDEFRGLSGIAVDSGGTVYTAEIDGGRISKITPDGVVITLAGAIWLGSDPGTGANDGAGAAARFNRPGGVAVDASGTVYVADSDNYRIRKITPAGVVTTWAGSDVEGLADGVGTAARFRDPEGVAVDSSGTVYVADLNRIRKISSAGEVTTLAGSDVDGFADGVGAAALFSYPSGVAVDASGVVYVADTGNRSIRKITPDGVVTTLAGPGGGLFARAQFTTPTGVAVDSAGVVYVADTGNEGGDNNGIRKITPEGVVTTLAGSAFGLADGVGTAAMFRAPQGVAVDSRGVVYVSDGANGNVRKIQ